MRRFAISDIHGCLKSFQALLQQISYTKKDTLCLLGDYIDRGPDSKGVIDHIWELQEEGYAIHCLRGNHEQMLLNSILSFGSWKDADLLASFGVHRNDDIPKSYINWMKQLDYFIELEGYILVHAGLNFKKSNPLKDEDSMIWMRYWYDEINHDWLGKRLIVHGHTPTRLTEIKQSLQNLKRVPVINIDAGCVYKVPGLGHLCALDLDKHQITFQPRID